MNKTELKNFAVSARRDLLKQVALRAKIFGIDENNGLIIEDKFGQLAINGETYSNDKKSGFLSLKKQLETKGYEQLIEEVAYTWFNRIIAIRYMEVNDYLPERVNVLSSSTGKVEPDILAQFETMDLNLDTVKIKELIRQGETESAYRQLFIGECNALNKILPFMFEQIQDYTELLLPDYLLDSESVIKKLVSTEALTESFTEVEVIGWLYQFYNSEPKDKVFSSLQKNKKIEKYDIPAATQLFTPKWIVQYMVENSIGQLWLESNPNSPLKESMRFYIEPAEQDDGVEQKLEEIRYNNVKLEEITIIDPCVGSGHILVYAFDLLYRMYEEAGYLGGDIPQLILEKNLFGLDIDDRAAQLASFALMMKAREKSRRIFRKQVELNIYSIQDSNHLEKEGISQLLGKTEEEKEEILSVIDMFIDAKSLGSILQPLKVDTKKYLNRIKELGETQLAAETFHAFDQLNEFINLLRQVEILSNQYDVAITNPPYMGTKGMNEKLSNYLKKKHPNAKSDLFAVFIEILFKFIKVNGISATINQHSWMFLPSYTNLREWIIGSQTIDSMVHLGTRAFEEIGGEVVQTTSYVLRKCTIHRYKSTYVRLTPFSNAAKKIVEFFNLNNKYVISQDTFSAIPGNPIAYWASDKLREIFKYNKSLDTIASLKVGLQTGDNERFLKLWHEIEFTKIGLGIENAFESRKSHKKWFPYNKGGKFKKWYGNLDYVVNWEDDGKEIKDYGHYLNSKKKPTSRMGIANNSEYYFRESLTWSTIGTNHFGARFSPKGAIFDNKGSSLFTDNSDILKVILGALHSKITESLLSFLTPTVDFVVGQISKLPFSNLKIDTKIIQNVDQCIRIAKEDWDSYETSWDFKKHPFLSFGNKSNSLSETFNNWENHTKFQFTQLKSNEIYLNHIFIDSFGLQNELSPEVPDEEITINKADRIRDSKSFLSYFMGCILGRYSLDVEGLAFAGGEWNYNKYKTYTPNKFGLIQLTDEHYFENDIILRLREFLSVTFGAKTVEENLQWLAESLELKRTETAEERLRRYFLDEFFKDHCQVYQKRPIYWLVDSGKQKGLRTLIYMHRYQPDTMATIRFEHLQEIQSKYNNEIAAVDLRIVNPNLSATEKRDFEKRKTTYQKRLEELLEFDKKLAEYANEQIAIDLDDGVKVNYAKFEKVLAKIK